MRADFKAFLLTGAIKSLRVGSTQAEVIGALGEPDDKTIVQPLAHSRAEPGASWLTSRGRANDAAPTRATA